MVNAALGGSTNFILHLTAIAKRIGVELEFGQKFDHCSFEKNPTDRKRAAVGEHWVEDLFYAGGLPAWWKKSEKQLNPTQHGSMVKNHWTENIEKQELLWWSESDWDFW